MITSVDIANTKRTMNEMRKHSLLIGNITKRNLESFLPKKKKLFAPSPLKSLNQQILKNIMKDAEELFKLGYGGKFISLCLALKYNVYISPFFFHRNIIQKFNRSEYLVNNNLFNQANIICKGRVFYNKFANSFYLTFKCMPLKMLAKNERVGIKVYFDSKLEKIFLVRDNRSSKKVIVHQNDLFVSLKPIPQNLEIFRNSKHTYKSKKFDILFSTKDFGFKRSELIQDKNSRKLSQKLEKYGFTIVKERITNMDRSKGDLHLIKSNRRIVIEITNLNINQKAKFQSISLIRDRLLGKITRICLENQPPIIFIFNKLLKNNIVNEDFLNVVKHFKTHVLFTNFKFDWEEDVAKQIYRII